MTLHTLFVTVAGFLMRMRLVVLSHVPHLQAFVWLWGRDTDFWSDFLRAQGEGRLEISRWSPLARTPRDPSDIGKELKDLFPRDKFDEHRELTFTHPRTGFVVGESKLFFGM